MEREEVMSVEGLWTWKEVAAFLRIGRNAVYDMAARGELPNLRIGGSRVRFVPSEIRAWLERQRAPAAAVLPLSSRGRLAKSAIVREGEP